MYPRRVRPMRAAFLLLAGLMGAALGSPAPVSHAAASLTDAVWVAFRCKSDGGCVKGTAFHVGGGIFYTNAHVARERSEERRVGNEGGSRDSELADDQGHE